MGPFVGLYQFSQNHLGKRVHYSVLKKMRLSAYDFFNRDEIPLPDRDPNFLKLINDTLKHMGEPQTSLAAPSVKSADVNKTSVTEEVLESQDVEIPDEDVEIPESPDVDVVITSEFPVDGPGFPVVAPTFDALAAGDGVVFKPPRPHSGNISEDGIAGLTIDSSFSLSAWEWKFNKDFNGVDFRSLSPGMFEGLDVELDVFENMELDISVNDEVHIFGPDQKPATCGRFRNRRRCHNRLEPCSIVGESCPITRYENFYKEYFMTRTALELSQKRHVYKSL